MQQQLNNLDEFNKAFGIYANSQPTGTIPAEVQALRVNLFREEFDEYVMAASRGDIVNTLDALTDLLYVLLGTIYAHGLQDYIEPAFAEVHASNMRKFGVDENGKAVKSRDYQKPNLAQVLERGRGMVELIERIEEEVSL